MAVDFITIFGNEINLYAQPRQADRQYTGFPGAHGLVAMHMGTRGRQLVITGRLRATGSSYSAARSNLQEIIDEIEAYQWADAADYTFKGETYGNVVFDRFNLVPDGQGKAFFMNSIGEVFADFVCYLRIMI